MARALAARRLSCHARATTVMSGSRSAPHLEHVAVPRNRALQTGHFSDVGLRLIFRQ
jgi:hypothetical protein